MTDAANIQGDLHIATPLGSRRKKIKKVFQTLYVNRPVLNADEIIAWAKEYAGCTTCVQPDDMHVTIAFSREPIEWPEPRIDNISIPYHLGNQRSIALFGPEKNCVVLRFDSQLLQDDWQRFVDAGASWDWSDYHPHITLSYQGFNRNGITPAQIPQYKGVIELGPEVFAPVSEGWGDNIVQKAKKSKASVDYSKGKPSAHCGICEHYEDGSCELVSGPIDPDMWCELFEKGMAKMNDDFVEADRMQKRGARNNRADKMTIQQMHDHSVALGAQCQVGHQLVSRDDSYDKSVRIAKIDESLGLVFGYAIVCKIDGKPYYDLNVDKLDDGTYKRVPEHIPEESMLKAAVDFMQGSRPGNEMHKGDDTGTYVFAFPMTTEIAKAFGIETRTTGLMIAYKPSPEVFAKFKDGTYKGFSIEGRRVKSVEQQ